MTAATPPPGDRSLAALAEELIGFEGTRTDSGWNVDDAVARSRVGRLLVERLQETLSRIDLDDAFECSVPVDLVDEASGRKHRATLSKLCRGGVTVQLRGPTSVGQRVEIRTSEHNRVRGRVLNHGLDDVEVAIDDDERRLRRVLDDVAKIEKQNF